MPDGEQDAGRAGPAAGIDAGASLWKLARIGEGLETELVPAGAVEEVRRRIVAWEPEEVRLTGGGAARLAAALDGVRVRPVPEFAAWARGAPWLAVRAGWTLPRHYALVSLGTGTSILAIDETYETGGRSVERIGGLALGGGTLLGLGRLLCGVDSFAEITVLAARGERGRVDLLVGDIYPEGGIALPAELTASNFAKLASRDPADLAHALMGLIGENIGIACAAAAKARGLETLVFGGSVLEGSYRLEEILRQAVAWGGREALVLPDGAFCGAVGAALSDPSL